MEIAEKLQANGWEFVGTGGGCTAFEARIDHWQYPDGWYWLITKAEDDQAPDDYEDRIWIGLYDEDSQQKTILVADLKDLIEGRLILQIKG